jgi:RNA-binding proteins (RRM domain)
MLETSLGVSMMQVLSKFLLSTAQLPLLKLSPIVKTNRSRGFGFVEMSDGGENAIQALNDAEVEGRKLVVNESRPRD